MKKLIVFVITLAISTSGFSQPTTMKSAPVKTDYLKKSKKQKTIAWSLLLGGIALEGTAFAFYETGFGANLARAGFLATLASIPFFIMAHNNKKKGMSLSLKNETVPQLLESSIVNQVIPSLTLKISL